MFSISPAVLIGISGLLGPLSHALWFIHGEHDFYSRIYFVLWTGGQTVAFFILTRILRESYASAFSILCTVSTSYLTGLFTSILLYRLFFHQLGHFPGPLAWRVTKLTQVIKNSDAFGYKHLDKLHKKYGKFVRTGPSEISIIDPEAPQIVLGPGSKCKKAIWYDIQQPLVALHTCRDKKLHDVRRRVWDRGFNAKSLRDYELRVSKYTNQLMEQLQAFGSGSFNASKWFNYYSFDVMGDLAFGEPFHMLDTGEMHFAIELLRGGMEAMCTMPAAPWMFYLLSKIPALSARFYNFVKWCDEQAEKREQIEVADPDIMSHLLEAEPMSTDDFINKNWRAGDSRLVIVAGSDTTAATITFCTYEIMKHPDLIDKLRKEVHEFIGDQVVDHNALQDCELLNAVIDETLRLHPPVPSGLIRIAPKEGLTIAGTFIPGETIMVLPLYTIQRSPEAYEHPDEFIPERWTTKPQLIKKTGAFAPFSLGPFGCVGKNLAYMEVRAVISKLITEFDIGFADKEDGSRLVDETHDQFTLDLADMFMVCKPRKA